MFEKLTVEEEKNVRGGVEENDLPTTDLCDPADAIPPDKPCLLPA